MGPWSRRVSVKLFNLLGGEPTIHCRSWRVFVGDWWWRGIGSNAARIKIVSNGFSPATPSNVASRPGRG